MHTFRRRRAGLSATAGLSCLIGCEHYQSSRLLERKRVVEVRRTSAADTVEGSHLTATLNTIRWGTGVVQNRGDVVELAASMTSRAGAAAFNTIWRQCVTSIG